MSGNKKGELAFRQLQMVKKFPAPTSVPKCKQNEWKAYPEGLFASEIGVSRPSPEPTTDESTFAVSVSPLDVRTWPFVEVDLAAGLEILVGPLLVVCSELSG